MNNPLYHPLYHCLMGRDEPLQVTLVGAGGNGSQMLTGLARMHLALQAVGHPGLQVDVFDPDIVTEANVGRQLFSPADVGQFKSSVLVHRINLYFGLSWNAHSKAFQPADSKGPAFLVGCVDSVAVRRLLSKSRYYYWLDLGNKDKTGQVVLGRAKWKDDGSGTRPKTFFELFPELAQGKIKEDTAPSCSLAGALDRQDLFINQAVVTWGLHLLWSFIRNGRTAIQGYFINLETGQVRPIPIGLEEPKVALVPKRKSAHSNLKRKRK